MMNLKESSDWFSQIISMHSKIFTVEGLPKILKFVLIIEQYYNGHNF